MKEFTTGHLEVIINKQFEINGYSATSSDVKNESQIDGEIWYSYYTTTTEKEDELKLWLTDYYKQFVPKSRIEKEIGRFLLSYGLKTIS